MAYLSNLIGKISDTVSRVARIDGSTHTLQTIAYEHHEIHSGSHYIYCDSVAIASGATQDYLITTPDTTSWCHFEFLVDGTAITQYQLFEGTDKAGSTPQTAYNSNRNSLNTATTTIHKGTSGGTTDGTMICHYKSGTATNQARSMAQTRADSEYVLKQNTKYILRLTSTTDGNLTNVKFIWYEHTDKN